MTQSELILAHLKAGKTITPLEALAMFGCFRLGARIFDLKCEGHSIRSYRVEDERTGKSFAAYRLIRKAA